MEIVLCFFLGLWISAAGVLAYVWIKREVSDSITEIEKGGKSK